MFENVYQAIPQAAGAVSEEMSTRTPTPIVEDTATLRR
jgi:hypothetical protein